MNRNPTTNNLIVEISDGTVGSAAPGVATSGGDAESNTSNRAKTVSWLMGFNGTTWDRIKAGIVTVTATLTGFLNTLPWAIYHTTAATRTNNQGGPLEADSLGNLKNVEQFAPVYEDNALGKAIVEHRYANARVTADGQVKASAGFIHTVTFAATGTVTAGVVTIYDNTAESGTVLWSGIVQVGLNPVTITLNISAATGIYVGYDGTIANVATNVSYR